MAARLPRRARQRLLTDTALQLPQAVSIPKLSRQTLQTLTGAIAAETHGSLQAQLLLQQLHRQSPGLVRCRLIQGGFLQRISPAGILRRQPFRSQG